MAVISRESSESTASAPFEWRRAMSSAWALLPICLAAFIVYAPTLADWFSGDDFWFLRASQTHSTGSEILRSLDFRNVGTSVEFDRYRPLYPIVWRFEYALFGMHAVYYHAVVIGLHVACTALVWMIARRFFRESWAVNLTALIFAVHPAYTDAIVWISGGNRVFATFPYLLSLLCFLKFHETQERSGARAAWYYAASFLLFVVAVLFHSSALTLAAVLVAWRFLVGGELREVKRPGAWLPFVPFAAVVIASVAIQAWVRANLAGADQSFRFGYHQYANYGAYLGLTVQPIQPDNYTGALRSILNAGQGLGSVAMLLISIALLARRPAWGLGIFAVFWLYVSLLPDSTLILGAYGRVLYGSAAALAVMLVAAIVWARDAAPPRWSSLAARSAPYAAALLVPAVMFVAYGRTRGTSHDASRNEQFIARLRRDVPVLPSGTLYVANVPQNIALFGDSTRLQALAGLYYRDAGSDPRIVTVLAGASAAVGPSLKPGDRLYEYQR